MEEERIFILMREQETRRRTCVGERGPGDAGPWAAGGSSGGPRPGSWAILLTLGIVGLSATLLFAFVTLRDRAQATSREVEVKLGRVQRASVMLWLYISVSSDMSEYVARKGGTSTSADDPRLIDFVRRRIDENCRAGGWVERALGAGEVRVDVRQERDGLIVEIGPYHVRFLMRGPHGDSDHVNHLRFYAVPLGHIGDAGWPAFSGGLDTGGGCRRYATIGGWDGAVDEWVFQGARLEETHIPGGWSALE